MLKNWTNLFIYHIKNNKLFTFLNVLGLSIGIAGLIFATLYWNDEHSYNEWNPGKENVFINISKFGSDEYWASTVVPFEEYFKKDFPELESYCYFDNWYEEAVLMYKNKKEIVKFTYAQNTFFEMFPFTIVSGSTKKVLNDNTNIALSQDAAKKLFGDENPMGKTLDDGFRKLVVGCIYTIPGNSSMAPEVIVNSIDERMVENKDHWGNYSYGLLLKLKNPDDKDKVVARMERLMYENSTVKNAKNEGITPKEWLEKNGITSTKFFLQSLKDVRLHAITECFAEGNGNYQFLLIMIGLSLLILVLSIVNYVNLATANAVKRAKEVGIRKVLGASKSNIIKQFLFETIITVLFSILISLVIVELSLPYYNEFLEKKLVIFGNQFYIQIILIFITTIIFAGIFPAIYVSNFETLKVLKGNFGRSKNGIWLRNGMLIFQFAIASFFILGSFIVYQQIVYISSKDLGFKGDQVAAVWFWNGYNWREKDYKQKVESRYLLIKSEISKIKGVKQVATGSFEFGSESGSTSGFSYKGSGNIQARNMGVDFGMLEMMQIQLKEGRFLTDKLASDTINSMLVNETALRMMNEKNPIGKEVDWNGKKLKIVGVVKDFHLFGPQENIPPMVFFHYKTVDWILQNANRIYVKIDAQNTTQTIADIEKFWIKKVDTVYPFSYDFVDKQYARTYAAFVKQKNLFSLLNFVVILIALFGLFALATYSIQRRMKEIAIRKTLGAETTVLLKELSKQYILFCILGFIIALFPVYYMLTLWLENFVFRISISWIPFVVGFLILMVLTLLVVLSRAYVATRVNVLKYLKYE